MERKLLEDFPDEWYQIVQREVTNIYESLSKYPGELVSVVLQSLMQSFVYDNFDKEYREDFLEAVFEAFVMTFDRWDEESGGEETNE
jgi:hypothetical protein